MMSAHGEILDTNIIIILATNCHNFFVEGKIAQSRRVKTEFQFTWHDNYYLLGF